MRKAGILSVADTLDKVNCTYINPCAHNFMVVFAEYIRVRLRCASQAPCVVLPCGGGIYSRAIALCEYNNTELFKERLEYIRVRLRCASFALFLKIFSTMNIFACDCVVRVYHYEK